MAIDRRRFNRLKAKADRQYREALLNQGTLQVVGRQIVEFMIAYHEEKLAECQRKADEAQAELDQYLDDHPEIEALLDDGEWQEMSPVVGLSGGGGE